MKTVTDQLAEALAKAVNETSKAADEYLYSGTAASIYALPDWYPDAVTALAAYSVEKEKKSDTA